MRRSLLLLSLLFVCPLFAQKSRAVTASPTTIRIGALVSTTGDWSTLGNATVAALDLAAADINAEMVAMRLPYRVETFSEDTALDPAKALTRLTSMASDNVQYVIGPQSSAEAAAVRDFANAHNIILISQGSTASSLAIAGDNLFRLAPNDKLEGAAIAALIRSDGYDTLVPAWRLDAGNIGLRNSTAAAFTGSVANGVSYDPSTTDFTTVVTTLGSAVRAIKSSNPTAKIAIYLASFDEAVDIFNKARLDPDLASVRWYGGDGTVQSQAILANANAVSFANTTGYTAPNVGLDDATKDVWGPVSDAIKARVGLDFWTVQNGAWVRTSQFVGGHIAR